MTVSAQSENPIKVVSAENLTRPAAVFSHAVISDDLIFISGQAGVDFSSGKLETEFEKQARQSFENLKKVLEASGSDLAHVVKVTAWLKNAEDFAKFNALYKEYFPVNPPARSTPIVALPLPEYKISLEAIAVVKK